MARTNKTRAAHGAGSIRHRADGLWEARFTYQDDLGQTKRGSVYAPTQKECRQKLTAALNAIDEGTYRKGTRVKVGDWLDEWLKTYCVDLKPQTIATYKKRISANLTPYIGNVNLSSLTNAQVQRLINLLSTGDEVTGKAPLAPKTVKCVHGILHKACSQAVVCGLIQRNPADYIKLPKVKKPELKPMMDSDITRFIEALNGEQFGILFFVDLFSGLRQSEILGLQWEDINFEAGTITVCRQLQKDPNSPGYIFLDETKNGKQRTVTISPSVINALRTQKRRQTEWQLASGGAWSNERNLVFTDELGGHLKHTTVRKHFKRVVKSLGLDETRFHDMRHSYAINALQYGDTPKEVCDQLGHYSTAFTMDVYGGVSETARRAAQDRMECFIQSIS